MDTNSLRFAYCDITPLLILLYWSETEMCSIWGDGELKNINNAQRHSPRLSSNVDAILDPH